MKKIIKTLGLTLLLSSSLFAMSAKELATTIDLSGKQRMLTQKMTKEVILIKLGIDKKENIEKLTQSSQLFDKTLKALLEGDKELKLVATEDSNITKQLKKIVSIWNPFYQDINKIIGGTDDKKIYHTIASQNSELLKEMDLAVELYTSIQDKKSNFILANDMNLAGKQRMLLQKMAKSLLLANNNIEPKKYQEDFVTSQALFTKTLKGLSEGESSLKLKGTKLPKIDKQLQVVEGLWNGAQKNLQTALRGKDTQKAIADLEKMTTEMDKTVKLYTASLNRHQQRDEFTSLIQIHDSLEKMDSETRALMEKLAKSSIK